MYNPISSFFKNMLMFIRVPFTSHQNLLNIIWGSTIQILDNLGILINPLNMLTYSMGHDPTSITRPHISPYFVKWGSLVNVLYQIPFVSDRYSCYACRHNNFMLYRMMVMHHVLCMVELLKNVTELIIVVIIIICGNNNPLTKG